MPKLARSTKFAFLALLLMGLAVPGAAFAQAAAPQPPQNPVSTPRKVRAVGTVTSITANSILVAADWGSEFTVVIRPETRLLRMAPGEADLKTATPIKIQEVQAGDRLLAAGTTSGDGKVITASSAVVMKKADISARQQQEREDWQKRGVGGVVKSVDAAGGNIVISTGGLSPANNTLTVHLSKQTIIRRYAPDSVKFDDAKPGTLEQIHPGDQLRARGDRSADGRELTAEEIVSGAFRNIAGTVLAADASNNTVTVTDLASKRPVTMKITADSQMHKLPPMVAQGIAMRLKGGAPGAAGGSGNAAPAGGMRAGNGAPGAAAGGPRGEGGGRDFQQMLNRLPALTLDELHKGDALMIVATEGSSEAPSVAIVVLSGVEPILTAAPSQASTILSPWNLSTGNAGTGDAQ